MLYIGADHKGFKLKEKIKKYLESLDIEFRDVGAFELDEKDDYPDYAGEVARYTRLDRSNLGIAICGSGNGMCITANKYAEIRAANCFNVDHAKLARQHNGANVMCLGSDIVSFDDAKKMVLAFIKTPFSMEERHVLRLNKVLDQDAKIQG